jgi:hypothetical protein
MAIGSWMLRGSITPRSVRLLYRPASVAAPADLDPKLTEGRPVGLALHRLKLVRGARLREPPAGHSKLARSALIAREPGHA